MRSSFFDNRAGKVISAAVNAIWLGFIWIIASLPVITIGAASTALYYSMVKAVRHERGRPAEQFIRAFRENWKTGSLVWLIYLGYAVLVAVDFWLMGSTELGQTILRPLPAALLIPIALTLPWCFAYISRFENSAMGSIRYVLFFSFKHLGRSLLLMAIEAVFSLVICLAPVTAPFLPGLYCLLASSIIEPAFRALTKQTGDIDAWYNE